MLVGQPASGPAEGGAPAPPFRAPAATPRPAPAGKAERGPAEEHEWYIERLEAFAEQHRDRLEELLRAYGPGSRPASHGRYALIGQPETLVILERMETHPFGLRSEWEKELETVFLGDLEFAWGPRIRPSR
ncbi:hypothetical protein ACFWUZ_34295 [Streptomyces sp. NPDC058646]|uniref:hypothetical protein n=1 Tax=Streptomyces sp. NPDC058646 TaxID=3346574 RepID=UPI00364CB17A